MMRRFCFAAAAAALLWSTGTVAAERTVTLAVGNLFCASCPYIVKQTLAQVPGVRRVDVSYSRKTAVVTFDDAKTNVAALTDATSDMGFPSTLKGQAKCLSGDFMSRMNRLSGAPS